MLYFHFKSHLQTKAIQIMYWINSISGRSHTASYVHQAQCSVPHKCFLRTPMDTYLNTLHQSALASSLFFADECRGVNIKGKDADRISKLVKKTRLCWRAEPVHPEGCELNWTELPPRQHGVHTWTQGSALNPLSTFVTFEVCTYITSSCYFTEFLTHSKNFKKILQLHGDITI